MSAITTHVLDTADGTPAHGINVVLEQWRDDVWVARGAGSTNSDGRIATLLGDGETAEPGTWRLRFDIGAWAAARDRACFHPSVTIDFTVAGASEHYHVPLLWSPYGYSTYRGS